MQLTLLDQNVSITMNVFLSIANIINLIYNVPQVIKTYKTKSTKDFSSWFIFLRILGNIIWIVYAIEIDSLQMLINNCVTVLASLFIGYYKSMEIYKERKCIIHDDDNYQEQLLEEIVLN
jgi:MtN3 and saliva related transmembrane protein